MAGCQLTPEEDAETPASQPVPPSELPDDSVIGVFPLQSSAVETLTLQAQQHVDSGHYEAAELKIEEAIALAPDDTALWQHLAEVRLLMGRNREAISAAQHSYLHGPQVGPLCEKNWRTIAEAQHRSGWEEAAVDSLARAEQCRLKARPRL